MFKTEACERCRANKAEIDRLEALVERQHNELVMLQTKLSLRNEIIHSLLENQEKLRGRNHQEKGRVA